MHEGFGLGHLDHVAIHVQLADGLAKNVPAGICADHVEVFSGAASQVTAAARQKPTVRIACWPVLWWGQSLLRHHSPL
jgi:hypothetical protein